MSHFTDVVLATRHKQRQERRRGKGGGREKEKKKPGGGESERQINALPGTVYQDKDYCGNSCARESPD